MGCQEGEGAGGRKSFKAWVAKREGGKNKIKKIIESTGCQEGGRGKIDKKRIIENMGFKNKARAGGGGHIIQSMGCQDEAGGNNI